MTMECNKRVFFVVIILTTFLVAITGCSQTPVDTEEGQVLTHITFGEPYPVNLSISKAPALGETAEITVLMRYEGEKIERQSKVSIDLPEGFELLSGNTTWIGLMGTESQFSLTIRAVKTGNWTLKASSRIPPNGTEETGYFTGGWDRLYLSVLEDSGVLHEEPFPPEDSGSYEHIKLNDSEIPPEQEDLSHEGDVAPTVEDSET